MALANYARIRITVPGDPLLAVGQTINFNVYGINPLKTTGPNASKELDPFYSGKYLLTAVRQIVKPNQFISVLEMVKDSVAMSYSATSDSISSYVKGIQI